MNRNKGNRPQFKLSSLLLLLTCFGLLSGWLADSYRKQRLIAKTIQDHQTQLLKLNKEHSDEISKLSRQLGQLRKAGDVVKSFQVLSFHNEPIHEQQIRLVARFPELRKLDLSGSEVTPKKLERITELYQLESLNLAHNPQLNDESLSYLQNMPRLREVELTACRGLTLDGIRTLTKIPTLERVRLDHMHRDAAPELVAALPKCKVVFANIGKLESFGVFGPYGRRQTRFPDVDPWNRLSFGTIKRPISPNWLASTSQPGEKTPITYPTEDEALFLKALETFIANPRDESACKQMLSFSDETASPALRTVTSPRRAFYLLARLNQDRANPDLSKPLFQLPFAVLKRVAKATFWPQELPKTQGDNVYFAACEKIEGTSAVNVLWLMSTSPQNKINGLNLIENRTFVFAVEKPKFEWAKAFYGDIGRLLYTGNSVQRFDCRGSSAAIPTGMELPMIDLTKEQAMEWGQNAFPTPVWSAKYLPKLAPKRLSE